jgi:hemerythrin
VADYLALKKSLDAAGGGGAALTIKVQNWCGDWLKAHIAGTDQLLATFLGKRG